MASVKSTYPLMGDKNGCYHKPLGPDPPTSQGTSLSVEMGAWFPPLIWEITTLKGTVLLPQTLY